MDSRLFFCNFLKPNQNHNQKSPSKRLQKMASNPEETPLAMVFGILEDNAGQFLTAREILSKVFEKHSAILAPNTVKACLFELMALKKPIEQATHVLYKFRIPTAVFKLQKHHIKIEKSCSETS